MSDYAKASGRSARPLPVTAGMRAEAKPLSETELARAEEARVFVCTHLPEALPFIRALVSEGMMAGWRDIQAIRL